VRLHVSGLTFAYGEEPIVDGVDLSVAAGELLGIVGPNGSGKTTLLCCLDRILEPDAGTVSVDGDDLAGLSRAEIARRIGYVPQEDRRTFPTTVFDTILLGRTPHAGWRTGEDDREATAEVIDRLGLEPYALRSVDELSGGQRRMVSIGRAIVGEPSVLLLDEPTAGLDVRHRLEVLELLRELLADGTAAVMVIHDLNLAARYCDRLAMLREGRVVATGDPGILTPETIREVYGVEATVTNHGGRRLVIPERPFAEGIDRFDGDAD